MINLFKQIDIAIFEFVNISWHFNFLDKFFIIISSVELSYAAVIIGLFLLIIRGKFHKVNALLMLAAAELSWFFIGFLKDFFKRPRPDEAVVGKFNLLINSAKGFSFPSGHAFLSFAVATIIAQRYPKTKWVVFTLAFLISYSRIYVGVHYPSDVLAGALLGFLVSYTLVKCLEREKL